MKTELIVTKNLNPIISILFIGVSSFLFIDIILFRGAYSLFEFIILLVSPFAITRLIKRISQRGLSAISLSTIIIVVIFLIGDVNYYSEHPWIFGGILPGGVAIVILFGISEISTRGELNQQVSRSWLLIGSLAAWSAFSLVSLSANPETEEYPLYIVSAEFLF